MKAGLLILVGMLSLLLVAGCARPEASEKAEAKKSLPVEQPLRLSPKKTSGERLVGLWEVVKVDQEKLSPQATILSEFKKDGTFVFRDTDQSQPPQLTTGTYTINGDTINLTAHANTNGPGKSWTADIEVLTEFELIAVAGPADSRQRSVSRRVQRKE